LSLDVLILCGAGYVSGKEIMVLTLSRELTRRGKTVHVATSSWNDGDFIARLDADAIPHTELRMGFISLRLRWTYLRMTLEQAVHWPGLAIRYTASTRRLQPRRVIHTNWHHAALLLPFLRPERDFLWLHEVIPERRLYRKLFGMFAARVREFIAVSEAVRRSLVRAGIPEARVRVIHNGLPEPCMPQPDESRPGGDVCVGIVGQVGSWKGHEDLVEALAIVAGDSPRVRLRIFGQDRGPYQDELRAKIDQLGLSQRIEWAGYVKDRTSIYSEMDICVVPSRSDDPLPTVAIEAGFHGIPVIATRRGGLPEIVQDGKTGLLVEPQSPSELARALGELAANSECRARMGKAARARMREFFSEDRFVTAFEEALERQTESHHE
jgi:glycosyltransferase involved in cell wall biosynthesis